MTARAAEHPQAPELGWARRLLGAFHVTGVFWFRFPYYGLRWVPRDVMPVVVFAFASGFFVALRRIRGALASNLEAVLGTCGFWERQRRIFRTMHAFAWCLAERHEFLNGRPGFSVSVDGVERIEAGSGSGLILVTAHVGPWETASQLIASGLKREAHVVREEELDPRAQAFTEELLKRVGVDHCTTHFASDDPRLGITLANALGQGHVVALQGDRPRANSRAVTVSIFGRPMQLPAGPAALSRTTAVPLVPVFSFREGRRRYRLHVRDPIHVAAESDRKQALVAATARLAQEIEWAIRREPHQWFCFKRLWG